MQKTCEVLEIAEFSESILRERVKEIVASDGNKLSFIFADDSQKTVEWQHRSRRESWTEEMKEDARKQTIARNERRRKNGSESTD